MTSNLEKTLKTSNLSDNETLQQGKLFKKYQAKITKREAFTDMAQQSKNILSENKLTDAQISELSELKLKQSILLNEYQKLQSQALGGTSDYIDRTSAKNAFLGKNGSSTNGAIMYVTQKGNAKWYPNSDVYSSTAGKNGCPSAGNEMPFGVDADYNSPGSIISTKPSLVVGSYMQAGQSCGNEGTNVYVNSTINNVSSSYIGTYNDTEDRAMTLLDGGYTNEDCKNQAAHGGYKYYATQAVNSQNGIGQCTLSNDLISAQKYGQAYNVTVAALWASNTNNGTAANVTIEGKLTVTSSDGAVSWSSPNSPSDCVFGGSINPDTLTATYGANCNSKGYNVTINNVHDKVIPLLTSEGYSRIPINNQAFGDPASGCGKSWDTSYYCGNVPKTSHIDYAEGQTYIYDCTAEIKSCVFFLILQDDGNLCLYRGTPTNNTATIWCTMTNGKQQTPNPNWVATKGKFGRNYISSGEVLYPGEFIGSNDGSLMLTMQTDGNLVLYTSTTSENIVKTSDGIVGGGQWANSIYEVNATGNPESIGNMGYVDENSLLSVYPDSMIGKSNDYMKLLNKDSTGNDLTGMPITNTTVDNCQSLCNNNAECSGFVFDRSTNNCWAKNSAMFPKGQAQPNNNIDLYIRKPTINNSSTCSKEIANIDSVQWKNYISTGKQMTSDTACTSGKISSVLQKQLDQLNDRLSLVGKEINSKTNALRSRNLTVNQQIKLNTTTFNNDVKEMQLVTTDKTAELNNVNGIVNDSDIIVLQENSRYIFWSVLALATVIVAINVVKK